MSEQEAKSKAELMAEIDRTWDELNAALDLMTEMQMTGLQDQVGWTVKDHLVHIAAWERTVIYHLQGQPRYEGLGASKAAWDSGDYDGMNAEVQAKYKDMSLPDALEFMRLTHQQLLAALQPLSDSDLRQPFRRWRPAEQGEGEGPSLIDLVEGNANGHYAEHLPWIQVIVNPK